MLFLVKIESINLELGHSEMYMKPKTIMINSNKRYIINYSSFLVSFEKIFMNFLAILWKLNYQWLFHYTIFIKKKLTKVKNLIDSRSFIRIYNYYRTTTSFHGEYYNGSPSKNPDIKTPLVANLSLGVIYFFGS